MAGEFIGAPKVTYIIDVEGRLWYWTQENQGNTVLYLPLGIFLGLLTGYLAALAWSPLVGVIRKSPPDYWNALKMWEVRVQRFGARLLSIPCLFYFVIKLLTSICPLIPYGISGIMANISIALVLVGLVISWRCEGLGGALILTAFPFGLPSLLLSLNLYSLMILSLPYLPGVLFLLADLLNRREHSVKPA